VNTGELGATGSGVVVFEGAAMGWGDMGVRWGVLVVVGVVLGIVGLV